jgi:integrase
LSLSNARSKAEEAKAKAGNDPAEAVKEERKQMMDDSRNTYSSVRDDSLVKYRGRKGKRPAPKTLREITRILSGPDFAAWANRPVASITKRDIKDALNTIMLRGETIANRSLSYVRLLFKWAVDEEYITTNPAATIKKPGAETSRDRVLSAAELRAIWSATEGDSLFNGIVRLLMLTGQRLNEVSAMRWSEIDKDSRMWTLPKANGDDRRAKNGLAHVVPLTDRRHDRDPGGP